MKVYETKLYTSKFFCIFYQSEPNTTQNTNYNSKFMNFKTAQTSQNLKFCFIKKSPP